jgi:hypothetical protein
MDIRPSHKVTRLSSPAKKRGVSGSPSKRYWRKNEAQN